MVCGQGLKEAQEYLAKKQKWLLNPANFTSRDRNKMANKLDSDRELTFTNHCIGILEGETTNVYEMVKNQMDPFIAEIFTNVYRLVAWQKGFIFRAHAPSRAPQMNQAEVVHAG